MGRTQRLTSYHDDSLVLGRRSYRLLRLWTSNLLLLFYTHLFEHDRQCLQCSMTHVQIFHSACGQLAQVWSRNLQVNRVTIAHPIHQNHISWLSGLGLGAENGAMLPCAVARQGLWTEETNPLPWPRRLRTWSRPVPTPRPGPREFCGHHAKTLHDGLCSTTGIPVVFQRLAWCPCRMNRRYKHAACASRACSSTRDMASCWWVDLSMSIATCAGNHSAEGSKGCSRAEPPGEGGGFVQRGRRNGC